MNILAIDTSSEETSCCLKTARGIYFESEQKKQSHAELLFILINKLLTSADVNINDIDYFAVSTGPGSYTGVRIGLSAVKGISFANQKPVIGLSKFDCMAYGFARKDQVAEGEYLICLDGKRDEVFCQQYRINATQVEKDGSAKLVSLNQLKDHPQKKIIITDEKPLFVDFETIAISKPDARDFAFTAAEIILENKLSQYAADPLYIRQPDYVKANYNHNNVQ